AAARHEQLRAAGLAETFEPGLDEVHALDHREPLAPTLARRAGQLEQATEALVARGRDLVSHVGCASAARSPPATARAPARSFGGAPDMGHAPEETRDARRSDTPCAGRNRTAGSARAARASPRRVRTWRESTRPRSPDRSRRRPPASAPHIAASAADCRRPWPA